MIKDLIFTCKVVGLIALILVGIVFIVCVFQGFIDTMQNRKLNRQFREKMLEAIAQAEEEIKKEKAKPKKKTTSKKTAKKDSE